MWEKYCIALKVLKQVNLNVKSSPLSDDALHANSVRLDENLKTVLSAVYAPVIRSIQQASWIATPNPVTMASMQYIVETQMKYLFEKNNRRKEIDTSIQYIEKSKQKLTHSQRKQMTSSGNPL